MPDELKLFAIHFHESDYYVEAASMQAAIDTWHDHMTEHAEEGTECWPDDDPETCVLVHGRPVIRGPMQHGGDPVIRAIRGQP